jgi:hypothetical protein
MVSWEFKDGTPVEEIARAVQSVSRSRVWVHTVDTGSEEYVMIIADRELTPEQVTETWQGRFRDG